MMTQLEFIAVTKALSALKVNRDNIDEAFRAYRDKQDIPSLAKVDEAIELAVYSEGASLFQGLKKEVDKLALVQDLGACLSEDPILLSQEALESKGTLYWYAVYRRAYGTKGRSTTLECEVI